MAQWKNTDGLRRREPVGMEELVEGFIKEMKLASGLNRQRIISAWNMISGAERYTVDVNLRNHVLYCTIGSSLVRNQLYFQKEVLLGQLNEYLRNDSLYVSEEETIIKDIVLR